MPAHRSVGATPARSPTGWASRCVPTWRGLRPMAAAARRDGLALSVTSAFRSDAEQARLFAANPNPKWVAPPGTTLHRYGTGSTSVLLPPMAGWGQRAAVRLHPPLRLGTLALRLRSQPARPRPPAQLERGSWEPPGGDHGRIHHHLPSFVPPRFHDPIATAALRWNVPMNLLAAQLYAESASTRSRRARRARGASPSSCRAPRAPTAWRTPWTPARRSMPRHT